MDMEGGPEELLVLGLQVRQRLREPAALVIVDNSNGPDDVAVLVPLLFDEGIADQVSQRLGTIGVALLFDDAIEALQQVGLDGNPEALEWAAVVGALMHGIGSGSSFDFEIALAFEVFPETLHQFFAEYADVGLFLHVRADLVQ